MTTGGMGSVANPVRLDPYQNIIEVGWGKFTHICLRLTVSQFMVQTLLVSGDPHYDEGQRTYTSHTVWHWGHFLPHDDAADATTDYEDFAELHGLPDFGFQRGRHTTGRWVSIAGFDLIGFAADGGSTYTDLPHVYDWAKINQFIGFTAQPNLFPPPGDEDLTNGTPYLYVRDGQPTVHVKTPWGPAEANTDTDERIFADGPSQTILNVDEAADVSHLVFSAEKATRRGKDYLPVGTDIILDDAATVGGGTLRKYLDFGPIYIGLLFALDES